MAEGISKPHEVIRPRISTVGMVYPTNDLDIFEGAAAVMRTFELEDVDVIVLDHDEYLNGSLQGTGKMRVRIVNNTTPDRLVNFWLIALEGRTARSQAQTQGLPVSSGVDEAMRNKAEEIRAQLISEALDVIRESHRS